MSQFSETVGKNNESFNSQTSKDEIIKRSESKTNVIENSNRKLNKHTFSSVSSTKRDISNSVGRNSTRSASKQKGRIVKNVESTPKIEQIVNISTDTKPTKSYMKQTDSSVKKNTRNSSVNSMYSKSKFHDLKSKTKDKITNIKPDAFLLFFQRLKQIHSKILSENKRSKTIKLVFFVFSPYIFTLIAMFKCYMLKYKDYKPRVTSQKPQKYYKDEGMLLDLKNAEIIEERKKVAELKKSNELLKKRVYSKNEFEAQYKAMKAEKEEFESKLKVSEKIRKQQKNLIKELQSQVNKLRKDKKTVTTKSVKPTRDAKIENENIDVNQKHLENLSKEKKVVMMPVYSTIPETDDSRDNSNILYEKDNSRIPNKETSKQSSRNVNPIRKDSTKLKKTGKLKGKRDKEVKIPKKLMR